MIFSLFKKVLQRITAIKLPTLKVAICAAVISSSLLGAFSLQAQEELLTFSNPEYEKRYSTMITELRCLVCQNQNVADSNAELAVDLKNKTYEMIEAGRSDADIKQFMRDRYGDFVLYKPPFEANTFLLWFGPLIVLAIVGLLVFRFIAKQNKLQQQGTQTENEDV